MLVYTFFALPPVEQHSAKQYCYTPCSCVAQSTTMLMAVVVQTNCLAKYGKEQHALMWYTAVLTWAVGLPVVCGTRQTPTTYARTYFNVVCSLCVQQNNMYMYSCAHTYYA